MTSLPGVRPATRDEVSRWDDLTVEVPDGDVKQSRAWADQRAAAGWRPHFLAIEDGGYGLAIGRARPITGAGLLHVPRGPVGTPEPLIRADRLAAIAAWAKDAGYDEIVADAEVPAATGYPGLLRERGFGLVDEVEPSRHRMSTQIAPGAREDEMRAAIEPRARQPFTAAERRGHRVIRHDLMAADGPGDGFEAPPGDDGAATEAAFRRFHALLASAGERRGFRIGSQSAATSWWRATLAAGHLVHLEVRGSDDTYLGGAIFMRHGTRLTYAHAADVVALRTTYPGVAHLVVWRGLQLAIREGRTDLDLGGVDVAGARGVPQPGGPMYGLYRFKLAFLGTWIEQSGAHARTLRPGRRRIRTAMSAAGRAARVMAGRVGAR